ncbi:MarR family winged helix-turn-helix transcriptional regulator [Sediminibacterium ginsengisoli]|uniref:HTH marR-type domain-containing protein n=1 Tax=Sediminibacterium ginsengisoli TaxID=413434 RepID=A0A1T4QCN4_9BACT|nr:MarR family transcriptional regulator [Sediminibacterium ginsengisoli]SKA01434.1 hypothetical protein SAMN04488132_10847 [Sediminibacterium ginsengisoli]
MPKSSIIDGLGLLAISTRLQRLSEQLRKDGQQIYRSYGIDFEPKWFPVVYSLHVKKTLSVVEIAAEIGYTHPSTISLLKELEREKIISSRKDSSDERKRLIQLTEKGNSLVLEMQPVWDTMTRAIAALTSTPNNLLSAITEVESKLGEKSFLQRAEEIKSGLSPFTGQ